MPVMVMMILPLRCLVHCLVCHYGMDLSMIVLLALIMLVGTVVNSSIVLIDYINIRRAVDRRRTRHHGGLPLRVRPL